MSPSIRWRIAVPYVALIIALMTGLMIYLSILVGNTYSTNLRDKLHAEAILLADAFKPELLAGKTAEEINPLVQEYGRRLNARVTVIAPYGAVLGDSEVDWQTMDNHLSRPEVKNALENGEGENSRYSSTTDERMMYIAVAVKEGQTPLGIVRAGLSLREVEQNTNQLRRTLLLALVVATLLSILLAVLIAERTARPLRRLTEVTQRMADGDMTAHILPTTRDEIGLLTRTFNQMAEQLHEKLAALSGERDRLSAILDHMADGVLITDKDGRVRMINPAAAVILNLRDMTVGFSFAQTVRDYQLIELWRHCHERGEEQIATLEINLTPRFLQVIITPLRTADLEGCLIILQDLTPMRRLQTVRRDFVSNVSHELRTPLASIKALADTLREGALADPPAARNFLTKMETEIDAMTQLVEELLELSRIESGKAPLQFQPTAVMDFVAPPTERLRPQAERAGITLSLDLPDDLPPVLVDKSRIAQVITNLVHNSIKFTPKGGQIIVSARQSGGEIIITVRDTGIGIPSEALPRIFERFYKADRARSGEGTGLGLSIARHIVQAHQGRIWAESLEGQGTTLFIALPVAPKEKI